jgi:hypothetical protein
MKFLDKLGRIAPRGCGCMSLASFVIAGDEAIRSFFFAALWIASLALAMTVQSSMAV